MERTEISDYRIIDVLGRGEMGVVYQAVHQPSGTPVAVKTVRVATESTLESIRREILMLRELRHPNVVAIRDHGVAEGMPWYAMELLRGRTLRDDLRAWFPEPTPTEAITRDLLRPGRIAKSDGNGELSERSRPRRTPTPPYSIAHVLTLFRRLCEPLAYVHGQGVIHRDLSPANVFLTDQDAPVLFDFGLAAQFRIDSAREVLEVGGLTRGTPHYMAPEQARGEVVDARADVYALGCLLFEAITGRPPFLGESSLAVLMQHIQDPAPPLSRFVLVPTALDALVQRMLAKAPRDRIGYVEDVAAVLDRLALGEGRSPGSTSRARGRAYTYRPSLAGRSQLVDLLDFAMTTLAGGSGGAAFFVGESGVGKTRLVAEIGGRAREHGIRVVTGECEPHGAPLHPLRPLLQLIVDRCREGGAVETQRLLGRGAGVLAQFEPALAQFAPVTDESLGLGTLHTAAARDRVFAALYETMAEFALGAPLLLVLDDLQWADELTLAALAAGSAARLATMGIFVLATVRAEERSLEIDAALAALGATQHEVPRLGKAAVTEMIRDMLALDAETPSLTDFVAARSERNPLFAAEYIRIAVDEGVLHRDDHGRWRLSPREDTESYDKLPVPGSIQLLMRRRLRWLSDDAREVVLAMSVLGRTAEASVLAATAAVGDERTRDAVVELLHRHVIEEATDGELRFIHDKLREQAYAELGAELRVRLHRQAALAMEARYRADAELVQRLGVLAHHWEQAGELRRAAEYLERSAEHALAAAAYGEARTQLERLLALAVEAVPAHRARWERWLGEACYALGDLAGTTRHTERSLAELGQPLPGTALGWTTTIARGLAQQAWAKAGMRPRSRPAGREGTLETAALASARMTSCYFFKDDSVGLIGAALAAVNLAERAGDGVPIAEIYSQLGYVAGLARLAPVARSYFAQARATAETTKDPIGYVKTLCTEAAYAVATGAWAMAGMAGIDALARSRALRNPQEAEIALTILGHVAFATGDLAGSRVLATELFDSARARAHAQHVAWGIYTEARADLYLGKAEAASHAFRRAWPLIASGDDASRVLCGGMHASALARSGELAEARGLADATTARIGKRTPPVFTIAEGFVGAADAYLELRRRTGDASLDAPTRVAIANLVRLARVFPIAGPAAANALGRLEALRGNPRRSRRAFRRALALATTLSMPFDAAQARAGLVR